MKIAVNKKEFSRFLQYIQVKASSNDSVLGSSVLVATTFGEVKDDKISVLTKSQNGNVIMKVTLKGITVEEEGKFPIPVGEFIDCLKSLKEDKIYIEYDRQIKLTDGRNGWEFSSMSIDDITDITETNILNFDAPIPRSYTGKKIGEFVTPDIISEAFIEADVEDILNAINAGKIAGKRSKTMLVDLEYDFLHAKMTASAGLIGEKRCFNEIKSKKLERGDRVMINSRFSFGIGNIFQTLGKGMCTIYFFVARDRHTGEPGHNLFIRYDEGNIRATYYLTRVPSEQPKEVKK